MADLHQIVDQTRIRDYQSTVSSSEGLALLLKIFHGVVPIDAMGLEKTIRRDACQTEHFTQLWFGDTTGAELLKREAFECSDGW